MFGSFGCRQCRQVIWPRRGNFHSDLCLFSLSLPLGYRCHGYGCHGCAGGAAGAVSRITGTLGKGLATLTLDDDYQRKRREQLNKRPASALEGFARGGKGLVEVVELSWTLDCCLASFSNRCSQSFGVCFFAHVSQ